MEPDTQFHPKQLLTDALVEIRIIGGGKSKNSAKEWRKTAIGPKAKLRNRVDSATRPPILPTDSTIRLPINDAKVDKEIEFLQDIMEELIDNCSPGEEYQEVNDILDMIAEGFKEECAIVEEYERNKKLYRYLDQKWKKDKEEFKDKLLKCDEKIFDLENERKETEIENSIKSRLVVKWEQARREQTEGLFEEEKTEYMRRIKAAHFDYEKELRIYSEVEAYTGNEIKRLNRLATEWEERYTRECQELDEEIKTAKVKIEKTQDKIQSLREIYVRRNIEIQSYLTQKAELEEARRVEKQKWDSAVRIQAWWRGTMFRNGLGPFRRKKKSKKGKTGKK